MKAIHGGKAKNDKIDSHKIAALLRGGMIPMSYVYPEKMRATRDLMRRRNHLVRKRSELYAHIQNTNSQYNLPDSFGCLARLKNRNGIVEQFEHPSVQESITADMEIIRSYDVILSQLEKSIINMAIHHEPVSYTLLQTIPGVGKIIALILLYEIENIRRFASVQDFVSYSRLVKCAKESNGKKCGSGGSKIGNAHLKWAFSEAIDVQLPGKKSGASDLQAVVKDTDLDVVGIGIIPMDDGVYDSLAQRLQWIIPFLVAGGFGADVHTHTDLSAIKLLASPSLILILPERRPSLRSFTLPVPLTRSYFQAPFHVNETPALLTLKFT
jgi:hypothetical protein